MIKFITIAIVIVLAGTILYYRGVQAVTKQLGLDCQYHFTYTVCTTKEKKSAQLPGIFEIIKAGMK